MPYQAPPELAGLSLAQVAELTATRSVPPVERWSPSERGDSHMRIAADGAWYHEGGLITRPAMVRAFASLLVCDEAGQHWLVTPTQKLSIEVEDAAFQAVDLKCEDGTIAFRLNTDEFVLAGPEHPILAKGDPDTPALYIDVRHGTRARLNRSTYEQLAEIALATSEGEALAVSSGGAIFPLSPA